MAMEINKGTRYIFKERRVSGMGVDEVKEGEWVVVLREWNYLKEISKVIGVHKECREKGTYVTVQALNGDVVSGIVLGAIRKATDKEKEEGKRKYFWNSNGRGVWELKRGDVLVNKGHGKDWMTVVSIKRDEIDLYSFLTDEVRVVTKEVVKNKYMVMCFIEDRKDVGKG